MITVKWRNLSKITGAGWITPGARYRRRNCWLDRLETSPDTSACAQRAEKPELDRTGKRRATRLYAKDEVGDVKLKKDRVEHWISKGAKPTEKVAALLRRSGVEVE